MSVEFDLKVLQYWKHDKKARYIVEVEDAVVDVKSITPESSYRDP